MIKFFKEPVIPKGYEANNYEKMSEWMKKLPVVKNYTEAIDADKRWNQLKQINNI